MKYDLIAGNSHNSSKSLTARTNKFYHVLKAALKAGGFCLFLVKRFR